MVLSGVYVYSLAAMSESIVSEAEEVVKVGKLGLLNNIQDSRMRENAWYKYPREASLVCRDKGHHLEMNTSDSSIALQFRPVQGEIEGQS